MKWFFSHLLLPILFAAAGAFFEPVVCILGFIFGMFSTFIINSIVKSRYPFHKKKFYLERFPNHVCWYAVKSDFLWISGVEERSATASGDTTREGCLKWIDEKVIESKTLTKNKKEYVYVPEFHKSASIKDNAEHVKEIAAQYNIKGGDALAKIEEIRRKTYEDEPPAKPMVEPPVVTKVEGHCVTYKKGGKTMTRSRQGFTKQYGEHVLSKIAPEPTKKASKRTRQRTKV